MKKALIIILALFLTACTADEFPSPAELYAEISESVEIGEMYDLADEMLEDVVGISPDSYTEAVYMTYGTGISPEEIIIVRAKDSDYAITVKEKLDKRLAYIRKSAENYLIEELPIIEKAVIRQDGLTLSLIVSEKSAEIEKIYESCK